MSAAKKITLKSLSEEFEKLKEEVIELRPLKKKVVELYEELKKVNSDRAEELKMLEKRIVDINGKLQPCKVGGVPYIRRTKPSN